MGGGLQDEIVKVSELVTWWIFFHSLFLRKYVCIYTVRSLGSKLSHNGCRLVAIMSGYLIPPLCWGVKESKHEASVFHTREKAFGKYLE